MNNKKLVLLNHTDRKLYYRLKTDTILENDLYVYSLNSMDSALPNFVRGLGEGVWEHKINTESIDSALHIFVFYNDTIPNNTLTNDIIKDTHFERFDLKVEDLNAIEWRLTIKQKDK